MDILEKPKSGGPREDSNLRPMDYEGSSQLKATRAVELELESV